MTTFAPPTSSGRVKAMRQAAGRVPLRIKLVAALLALVVIALAVISMVGLAGLAGRIDEFREPLERELRCPVGGLLSAAASEGHISSELRPLVERELDALVGWTLYRGS